MKDSCIAGFKERRPNRLGNQRAFTIYEAIVVFALISILSAVAIPNYISWIPRRNLSRAANDLAGNMQRAKSHAIKDFANVSVRFFNTPDRYEIPVMGINVVLSDYGSGVEFDGPLGQDRDSAEVVFTPQGLCVVATIAYAYLSNAHKDHFYRIGPVASGIIYKQKQEEGESGWE